MRVVRSSILHNPRHDHMSVIVSDLHSDSNIIMSAREVCRSDVGLLLQMMMMMMDDDDDIKIIIF